MLFSKNKQNSIRLYYIINSILYTYTIIIQHSTYLYIAMTYDYVYTESIGI